MGKGEGDNKSSGNWAEVLSVYILSEHVLPSTVPVLKVRESEVPLGWLGWALAKGPHFLGPTDQAELSVPVAVV